jgi:hypothetical protein
MPEIVQILTSAASVDLPAIIAVEKAVDDRHKRLVTNRQALVEIVACCPLDCAIAIPVRRQTSWNHA